VSGLEDEALALLGRFHEANPLKRGLGVEELRTKFPRYVSPRLVEFVLQRLVEQGRVAVDGEVVRRADFTLRLSADDEDVRRGILEAVRERGYQAPTAEEVAVAIGQDAPAVEPVLQFLVTDGALVRTKEGYFFARESLEDLVRQVVALLDENGQIGVADIKDLTGTTRKYTIPLLEYLDTTRVTVRKGDVRVAGPRARS